MANPGPTKYRVLKKIAPLTRQNILNPHHKEPSGTEGTAKRRLGSINIKGRVTPHRRGANYDSKKSKRNRRKNKMNETKTALKVILDNHNRDISSIIESVDDPSHIAATAKNLMKTCLGGWSYNDEQTSLLSGDKSLVVSASMFYLTEDSTIKPKNHNLELNYDWLYKLATAADQAINEESKTYGTRYQEFNIDQISDALSNASKVLKSLNDEQIKQYILEYEANRGEANLKILKSVLEDADKTPNWRLEDVEIDGTMVHIIIRVKYTLDGTEKGVVDRKLSIEVRPSHAVEAIGD